MLMSAEEEEEEEEDNQQRREVECHQCFVCVFGGFLS